MILLFSLQIFLRVDERSSDSYIGRDDFFLFRFFFSGKVLKFIQAQIHFFVIWLSILTVQFISFVKRKASSNIKQQKC